LADGGVPVRRRDENAPELPDADAASAAVDNLPESNPHRRRTIPGVDQTVLVREVEIGEYTRRQRRVSARVETLLCFGAWAAILDLVFEILRMMAVIR
jgi:hypothetical protein